MGLDIILLKMQIKKTINESDLHNFYVRETVMEYKKKMIDCINECLSDISTALDKGENHG